MGLSGKVVGTGGAVGAQRGLGCGVALLSSTQPPEQEKPTSGTAVLPAD